MLSDARPLHRVQFADTQLALPQRDFSSGLQAMLRFLRPMLRHTASPSRKVGYARLAPRRRRPFSVRCPAQIAHLVATQREPFTPLRMKAGARRVRGLYGCEKTTPRMILGAREPALRAPNPVPTLVPTDYRLTLHAFLSAFEEPDRLCFSRSVTFSRPIKASNREAPIDSNRLTAQLRNWLILHSALDQTHPTTLSRQDIPIAKNHSIDT